MVKRKIILERFQRVSEGLLLELSFVCLRWTAYSGVTNISPIIRSVIFLSSFSFSQYKTLSLYVCWDLFLHLGSDLDFLARFSWIGVFWYHFQTNYHPFQILLYIYHALSIGVTIILFNSCFFKIVQQENTGWNCP